MRQVQARFLGVRARKEFKNMKIKIVKCQALLRGKLARIRFRQLRIKTKSTIIQKTLCMLMQRRK